MMYKDPWVKNKNLIVVEAAECALIFSHPDIITRLIVPAGELAEGIIKSHFDNEQQQAAALQTEWYFRMMKCSHIRMAANIPCCLRLHGWFNIPSGRYKGYWRQDGIELSGRHGYRSNTINTHI